MLALQGQTAIVTGGTRGIGAAISRALLASGARVLATYARDEAAAGTLRESVTGLAGELTCHRFDVADPTAVAAFFADLSPPLQILINNAGIRRDALLGMMSVEAWERVLQVNLTGAFHMCKQAVRAMMAGRYGRIVNIVSPSGRSGMAGQANYAAAKAGLQAMSRSLALEVASRGITVNCLMPGFVRTDLLGDLSPERLTALEASVPLRRFGLPEEVAAAVRFLVSREAGYITGATLEVTGGA